MRLQIDLRSIRDSHRAREVRPLSRAFLSLLQLQCRRAGAEVGGDDPFLVSADLGRSAAPDILVDMPILVLFCRLGEKRVNGRYTECALGYRIGGGYDP